MAFARKKASLVATESHLEITSIRMPDWRNFCPVPVKEFVALGLRPVATVQDF
jgi:hypothetical protein